MPLLSREQIGKLVLKLIGYLPAPKITKGKKLIACIGDSITFGAGVRGNRNQTWESYLNEMLGNDYQVLNYGINGRTLQKNGDYPYVRDRYYRISRQIKADTYIIMLGSNDAKPYNWNLRNYEEELPAFIRSYADLPHKPRVIMMTPPHCYPDPKTGVVGFNIDASNIDNYITNIIRNTAQQLHLELIDLYEYTDGHPEWYADGAHPNALGNRKLAELIVRSFR